MRHRKFSHKQAIAGVKARLSNLIDIPPPEQLIERVPGYIIHFVNGKFTVVGLEPEGRCDQHRALFKGGGSILSGMDGIHAEIRKIMPPLNGCCNF